MMKKQLLYILFPIVILAFLITGIVLRQIGLHKTETPNNEQTSQQADIVAVYKNAITELKSRYDITLTVKISTQTQIGTETFQENTDQFLYITGIGTDKLAYDSKETITLGNHTITNQEFFADGKVYFIVNKTGFCGDGTAEDYLKRHTPADTLNADLYQTITSSKTDNGTTISFLDPTAPEAWAVEADAVLTVAEGKAFLDKDNLLTGSEYTVIYHHNTATVTKKITVAISKTDSSVTIPVGDGFTFVENPEAILLLERACGYLIQSNAITAAATETMACELFGDTRKQELQLNMFQKDETFSAKILADITLANSSRGDEPIKKQEIVRFLKNTCTITTDGVETTKEISAKDMRSTCQNLLLGTILLPADISQVKLSDLGETLQIDFTPSETFVQNILQNISQTLYQKPDIFQDLTNYYSTKEITCYLTTDKHTGIPLSSGIRYSGTHSINEYSYTTSFEATQLYTVASAKAQDSINE